MNLTQENINKIQVIDKITLETFKELAKADLIVDKLKGIEDNKPGLMQELVTEVEKLRAENYHLQSELYQLGTDMGKLIKVFERTAMSLTSDYDFQQLKNRHPA